MSNALEEKKYLGQEGVAKLVEHIKAGDTNALNQAKGYADSLADNYDPAGTAATKVDELAKGQVATNTAAIGTMDNLETTSKDSLVKAINEVRNSVSAGGTAAAVTMEENASPETEGVAKSYTIKQGDNVVGTINIPKDMVVQSGEVVTNPEGQPAGTYIKLILANATNDVIYVNVGTLVDIYKAHANAAQVQLAIDTTTREISATIVAGSITATELAADAVTTVKIADGNVTEAKLSAEVQASLGKADVAEANAKGHADDLNAAMNTRVEALEAIDHDHTNKAVLDGITAAKVTAWDAAEGNAKAHANDLNTAMDTRVKATEAALAENGSVDTKIATAKQGAIDTAAGDATTKANKALEDAKQYTDEQIDAIDLSGIETNAADIDKLEESLAEGGATANAIADAKKAGTDAQNAVDTLTTGEVANLRTDVDALKSVNYVEITAAEVEALFA